MYHYWGFGLHISSDIQFPELLTYNFTSSDVEFISGTIPSRIEGETFSAGNFTYQINSRELIFISRDTAKYYAENGNSVWVEVNNSGETLREVRLHMLATVMAAILLQRNRIPIHASAIKRNDSLILLTGDSGAGKSTSLAGLLKKGHTIFSDDIVVAHKKEDQVLAHASYPMIKMWNDSIEKINHPMFDDRTFPIRAGMDKYGLFFHDRFDTNPYPISKIFILKCGPDKELKSKKLAGADAFNSFMKQIYRPMLIKGNKQRRLCFELISEILKNGQVFEITRPEECNPDVLVDFIETLL